MGVPNKRLKKLMMTTGIALGVYAGLKYLLPLAIPFFVALGLAEVLRPWAEWLQEKLSFSVKGHRVKISLGILGGFLLLGLIFLASLLCYFGGKKLFQEGKLLLYNLPGLARKADILLTEWCGRMEEVLHLEGGCILKWARELSRNLASQAAARAMPYVMGNSVDWLKAAVKAAVVFVVVVFGTILAIQEGEQIHGYFKHSVFCREYVQMGRILKVIGAAYGKTQLLILAGTTVICIGGLFLIGNPYYGILDGNHPVSLGGCCFYERRRGKGDAAVRDLSCLLFPAPGYGIEGYGREGRSFPFPYVGGRVYGDPVIWNFGCDFRSLRVFDCPGIG